MSSTSLEMHQNRFRPGLRPGPHWGSLQRSLRPIAGGEGARRVLPKNPTSSSALRASAIQAMLCSPPTPPKINPSYGLGKIHVVRLINVHALNFIVVMWFVLNSFITFNKISMANSAQIRLTKYCTISPSEIAIPVYCQITNKLPTQSCSTTLPAACL